MKYRFTVRETKARSSGADAAALPESFSFEDDEEQLVLVVSTEKDLKDEDVFFEVQREDDRLSFLTGEQMNPVQIERRHDEGGGVVSTSRGGRTAGYKPLPAGFGRQDWSAHPDLALQLRLWHLAHLPYLPVAARVMLLFQIVEIAYPDTTDLNVYPKYTEHAVKKNVPPHPRTEALLVRHLAVHGKMKKVKTQLERYRQHVGIPVASTDSAVSHNATDANLIRILSEGLRVVKREAQKAIASAVPGENADCLDDEPPN